MILVSLEEDGAAGFRLPTKRCGSQGVMKMRGKTERKPQFRFCPNRGAGLVEMLELSL
jgi:hypothetical protein